MKKLLHKITGWLVEKTNYTPAPALPSQIQPIIIKPESLKKFHSQCLINWFELERSTYLTEDYYVKGFIHGVMNEFVKQIEVKREKTPDGIVVSVDLLYRNI